MNQTTDQPSDERLPEPLNAAVNGIAGAEPDAAEMRSFLDQLKQDRPTNSPPHLVHQTEHSRWSRRGMLGALAATAAALVLVFSIGRMPTANALELLAGALSKQSCIKMTTTADGQTIEHWIIQQPQLSAWRNKDWIEHYDPATDIVMTLNRTTGELVRSVGHRKQPNTFLVDMVQALMDAGQGTPPKTIRGMEVVSATTKLVDGSKELMLELNAGPGKGIAKAIIMIDPNTDLPRSANLMRGGQVVVSKIELSYPTNGPASIYALGVEGSTPLVDRVPADDIKRLVAGIYQGRVRFDDYKAVVIKTTREIPKHYGPGDVALVAKQGDRLVLLRHGASLTRFNDKTRDEVAAAVLADPIKFTWRPLTIIDGQKVFRFHADGIVPKEIDLPRAEFIIPSWRLVPHFAGRPPLGIGRGDVASALASVADGGPEGCVLLQTELSGTIPEAPADPKVLERIKRKQQGGYWVRANRDYLVMREDAVFGTDATKTYTLDNLAQSPSGFWYPTKASIPQRKSGVRSIAASHYSYHLNFEQSLPAQMFDPSFYIQK